MLTLKVPYKGLKTQALFERSIALKDMRPSLRLVPPVLANCVKAILRQGWQGMVETRFTICEMRRGIRHVLDRLGPNVCAKPCCQCGTFRLFRLSPPPQKKPHQYPSSDVFFDPSSVMDVAFLSEAR
jgi:hypothetical protein